MGTRSSFHYKVIATCNTCKDSVKIEATHPLDGPRIIMCRCGNEIEAHGRMNDELICNILTGEWTIREVKPGAVVYRPPSHEWLEDEWLEAYDGKTA